jgi:hypothetical protein
MNNNINKMIEAFTKVKELGFKETRRSGNTGIGKSLEDFLGIRENNIDKPDLHDFEIKSQRELATSKVTLFTKAPTNPKGANAVLKDNFGTPDENFPDIKVLHTSVYHDHFNTHKGGYAFKLECDDQNEKMLLLIKNIEMDKIVSQEVYWSYPVLRDIVENKIKNLAFVTANTRSNKNGREEFHFTKMNLFTGITFENLLNYIKQEGGLMFDIRIGAYKSGKLYGRPHDHGSGFRVKPDHLRGLYTREIIV